MQAQPPGPGLRRHAPSVISCTVFIAELTRIAAGPSPLGSRLDKLVADIDVQVSPRRAWNAPGRAGSSPSTECQHCAGLRRRLRAPEAPEISQMGRRWRGRLPGDPGVSVPLLDARGGIESLHRREEVV